MMSNKNIKKSSLSPYLENQIQLQRELKCEYVFVQYEKVVQKQQSPLCLNEEQKNDVDGTKSSSSSKNNNGPPQFQIVAAIPMKLSHQVFMQLAFNILKDRLLQTSSSTQKGSEKEVDIVALYYFLMQYLMSLIQAAGGSSNVSTSSSSTATVGRRRGGGISQRGGTGGARGGKCNTSTSSSTLGGSSSPAFSFTKQHLRLQFLLEYGVDVAQLVTANQKGGRISRQQAQEHLQKLMPTEIDEEEFFQQMGRPSGLAQECCIS